MTKKWSIFIIAWIFLYLPGKAQILAPAKFEKLPDSLFAKSQYPAHPDFPYEYSLKKLHITFGQQGNSIVAILHYHVRIKVFDSSVKQAAVVGIPYYFKNDIEHVTNIRGITYHSPGEKIPLDTKKVKTININSRYNVKEFNMPEVKDGSVIEYAYTIRRRYIKELPDFYLANRVPTKRAEVSITYPGYLRYTGIPVNFKRKINHFITKTDTSTAPKVYTYPQPPPIVKETWRALDVPAVKKEAYISSLDDYRGKIKFQLSEFGIPRQTLENSWKFVVADIRRRQNIFAHIAANKKAYAIGKRIGSGFSDKKAAQDSIFQYLSQRVNFSGSKTPFSSAGDTKVLEGEPSDQATINQTLTAMLRGAGIKAYPMLISTRKSGQINRSFPSFFQFNGQLVYSNIGDKPYFMDASFPFSEPNLIPVYMNNQTGLLLKPQSYRWVAIHPSKSVISIKVEVNGTLDRSGNLQGTVTAINSGYPAQKIRQRYARGTGVNQIIQNAILQGYSKVETSNARLDDSRQDVKLLSNFKLENYSRTFRSGIDFRPMMVGYLRQNPFSDENRKLPVTFDAPEHLHFNYTIHIPRGMSLASKPHDRTLQLPGAQFVERYQIDSNTLRYSFNIDLSQKQFSPDQFHRLLQLYRRWVQLSREVWHLKG